MKTQQLLSSIYFRVLLSENRSLSNHIVFQYTQREKLLRFLDGVTGSIFSKDPDVIRSLRQASFPGARRSTRPEPPGPPEHSGQRLRTVQPQNPGTQNPGPQSPRRPDGIQRPGRPVFPPPHSSLGQRRPELWIKND